MVDQAADPIWAAFVDALQRHGAVDEHRSRFADKPGLFLGRREIAQCDGPGLVDLRVTAAGWMQVRDRLGADPAVRHEEGRHDWIGLVLESADDLVRLDELLAVTVAANR